MFGQSLLSAFGSAACTTDTDQLFATDVQTISTATYQLNNATTSIPGNNYPGTPNNITYAAGKFGNAAVFNGNADIDVSSSAINTTSPYTISMWLNIVDVTQYEGIFANVTSSYLTNQIAFVLNNGKISIYSVASNGNTTLDSVTATPQSAITNNTWFNLVIIADRSLANKAKVFFNNVEASYAFVSGGAGTSSYSNIKIGLADGAGRYFNGYMDQIRFFNSSLPQPAITALYNETTTTAQSASVDYQLVNPNSVAYYKMSDATDQLGNYNGTASNVNFNTEGKFGFAGAFNGSSSVIDLGSPLLGQTHSVSLWFNADSIATDTEGDILFAQYASGVAGRYIISIYTNTMRIFVGGSPIQTISATWTANAWTHFVIVKNSSGYEAFVNGSSIGTSSLTSNIDTTSNTTIGAGRFTSPFKVFPGKIDQVRIYDSALSAANVTTLYEEIECPAIAVTNAFNTVLYTGDDTNTSYTRNVTDVGFKPDLVWIKDRDNGGFEHALFDSVRGAGASKILSSDTQGAEGWTSAGPMSAFITDGFSIQPRSPWNSNNLINKNGDDFVSWNWKAPLANLSTSFNGSSSYISAANILDTSSAFTYSLWINPDTISSLDFLIGLQQAASPYAGISLLGSGSNKLFLSISGGTAQDMTPTLTLGSWSHIVLTHDGSGNYTCYTNNNGSPITYSGATSNNSSNPFRIGFSSVGGWGYFDGKIDQVRIFNSILSASEISDLYAEPAASNNTLNYPAGAGCIAAYPLETDAVDLSGNYNGSSSNVTFSQPGYLTQNTEGTITSTVAANVDAGFSIVSWTGNGNDATVGTGLSQQAELVITKGTANLATYNSWITYHTDLPTNYHLYLNTADSEQNGAGDYFRDSAFTSEVFGLGNDIYGPNVNNTTMIAYCFHSVAGYSRVGSFIGGTSGSFVYTGFQPRLILIKRTDSSGSWNIFDDKINSGNAWDNYLRPNTSGIEASGTTIFTVTSTGFNINYAFANGSTYIFLAIA